MNLTKEGLFWRIVVSDGVVSKRRFLTSRRALIYFYQHQDRDGFPVVKKEKK